VYTLALLVAMAFGIPQLPGYDCFEVVLFLVERLPMLVAANIIAFMMVKKSLRIPVLLFIPGLITTLVLAVGLGSYEDARLKGFDMSLPSLRQALEDYIETGNGGVIDILESGKHHPTFGKIEMRYLLQDLMTHTFLHLDAHNAENMPVAYNKGNDWFRATLGEPMVYTSGIYKTGNESLAEAQKHKLDYVAKAIDLKKGDKVLDIGCGWGRLLEHLTKNYGAQCTGVTLSSEQKKYGEELNKGNGVRIELQDAMKLYERTDMVPEGGYDAITSLEMAEHVGIKRYQEFLTKVHSYLKDDGVLYFQVAGLRREWQYEDLVWGLFMGEHVFPGADASCPMGWVTTQLERAGFEVQRVQNLGNHYSRTLDQWLDEWKANKDDMVKKYGAKEWRRWEVFLAWSVRVARQGSSTVFMITATKAGSLNKKSKAEKTRIAAQARLAPRVDAGGELR
jgi:cyclopropane fatty-acyl-phospholipid synthase-like methyltransferase